MSGALETFCENLFGNRSGYVYVPVKKKDNSWETNFFSWPFSKRSLLDFIRTSSLESDVYISPALYKDKQGKRESVKNIGSVWIEFDGKSEIDFKDIPKPDAIVQTSTSTHLHCYWFLKEPQSGEAVEEVNRRLTYYLEADYSGTESNQVLRPPETFNYKTNPPKPVTLLEMNKTGFSLDSFDKAPVVETPVITTITYETLIPLEDIKEVPEALLERIQREMAVEPTRSTFLMSTAYMLAEEGFDHLEIVSLLYIADCRIKKFVGRPDQIQRLSEIASKALYKIEATVESYSPLEIVNHELDLDFIVPGWLHTMGMMILSGAPGVGKTQFSLDIAHKITTGLSVLGKEAYRPLKVSMFSLEMDIIELKYIFENQSKGFEEVELWNSNLKVFAFEEGNFAEYEKAIKKSNPDVLIIDSLSELAVDDLKESEARSIMRWLKRMRRTYGCAIIVIHHNRKASDANKKPRKLSDLYGSFIFAKLTETVISLWQDEGKPTIELDTLKVRFGKSEKINMVRSEHLTFSRSDGINVTIQLDNPLIEGQFTGKQALSL